MRLKKYLLIILSFAFAIAFVIGAPNATAKYYYSAEGEAFIISFPMMTVGQRNAVAYFLNILNQSNDALQNTLANVKDKEWRGNDWANGERFEEHDTTENENIEKLIALDAYYIVKFEPNEKPYKTFTMYSTPTKSSDAENGMTTKVFKTTFAQDASGKYYDVASWEGEALGSENYNTDFWIVKLETNQEYAVDLNLITDGDPGTNYDAQGPNGWFNSGLSKWNDGYTFITFTPEETGTYAINVNDAESDAGKAYRLSALRIDGNEMLQRNTLSNASDNSDVQSPTDVSNGVYSLNLEAGVKYYFRIQLPTPTTEHGLTESTPYNVKIAITKSE